MMLPRTILVAIVLASGGTAAFAQGTAQERAACRRDTAKFCKSVKPDESNGTYLACLQEHRAQLSAACRAVLDSNGM